MKKELNKFSTFSFSSIVSLKEGGATSEIEVLRVGTIQDRGLKITPQMLEDYVKNFHEGVYGTQIQVNLGHNREGEAAGWIKDLFVSGDSLMALVEWTELGVEKLTKKLYQFVSSELAPKFPHADTGKLVSNVFIGAALTNTPALKRQEPISLTEEEQSNLTHSTTMLKTYIENLMARAELSASDVTLAKELLKEASAEELETLSEQIEKLGEKMKAADKKSKKSAEEEDKEEKDEEAEEEMEEEEEAKGKKGKKGKKEEMSEKVATVSLAEFNAMAKRTQLLQERLEASELKEEVASELLLSEKVSVGFLAEQSEALTKFMLKLSTEQRAEFKALIAEVKNVDLSESNWSNETKVTNLSEDKEADAIVALADKLMKDAKDAGKSLGIAEAQNLAMKKIKSTKA